MTKQVGIDARVAEPIAQPGVEQLLADGLGGVGVELGGQELLDEEQAESLRRGERPDGPAGSARLRPPRGGA